MPIPVICGCKAKLKVADGLLGQKIKCPKCSKTVPVAEPKPDSPYYALYTAAPESAPSAPSGPALTTEQVLAQSPLTEKEREKVQDELDSGERVLWAGKPDLKIAFMRGWIPASGFLFFGLILMIFLIMSFVTTMNLGALITVLLVLALLIVVGLGVATPYYKKWLAEKMFYTVSNKRATIWGCTRFGALLPPSHFEPAELHGFFFHASPYWGEDVGDIIFGSKTVTRGKGKDAYQVTYTWGFFMVREGKKVDKIIREALVDPLLDKAYE
jgi:hypothetical protein